MNSHRLAAFLGHQTSWKPRVQLSPGDAMDVDAFTRGSKGASEGPGKTQDSEVVCLVTELPIVARNKGTAAVERFEKKATAKGKNNKGSKAKGASVARFATGCRSQETSAFEAGDEVAETGCIEITSIDLNALEIGTVQLPEKDHEIRAGIASSGAVTVIPKSVLDDNPDAPHARQGEELQTSVRQASARSGCAKGARQAQRRVSQVREPKSCGHARSCHGDVRNERRGTRCLLLPGATDTPRRMRTKRGTLWRCHVEMR